MNILLIIGNGFDLNLGMKTRYNDFYKSYLKNIAESNSSSKIKKNIEADYDSWADLEEALGKVTSEFNDPNEFELLLEDIKDSLAEYLIDEEKKFNVDLLDLKKFKDDIVYPEKYLLNTDKTTINKHKSNWRGHQWGLTIFTFNYSTILESLLINEKQSSIFSAHKNGSKIIYNGLNHIHGTADEGMVLGVNDSSQIINTNFHENLPIKESFIKMDCNIAQKHGIQTTFKKSISSSNLIIIFGSSIGSTDKIWWDLIAKQLKGNSILILFSVGPPINNRHKHKIANIERGLIDDFLEKTELSENDKLALRDKIFIGYNTKMFNLIQSLE